MYTRQAYALAAKLARAMKEVLGFTDMNILQNNGPIAGQTVFHFHIHLIPRREGDGINVTWTPTAVSYTHLISSTTPKPAISSAPTKKPANCLLSMLLSK